MPSCLYRIDQSAGDSVIVGPFKTEAAALAWMNEENADEYGCPLDQMSVCYGNDTEGFADIDGNAVEFPCGTFQVYMDR